MQHLSSLRLSAVAVLAIAAASCVRQPAPAAPPAPAPAPTQQSAEPGDSTRPRPQGRPGMPGTPGAPGAPGAPGQQPGGIRPYNQVITKAAKTRKGLFTTHLIGTRLYFEIPRAELNKDMLLVGRYAQAAAVNNPSLQSAYGGDKFAEETLRWELRDNKVLLRSPSFNITADSSLSVFRAVESSNSAVIMASFDVAAYGPDSSAVIDVTSLYMGAPEFAAVRGRVDEKRSFIEHVAAFPDNIEVSATQTGNAPPAPGAPPTAMGAVITVVAHWSMVRLPEKPLRPRIADDRVGYFSRSVIDFGSAQYRADTRQFITRWRLEKKDPSAALSEPVKPIVYYVDPATPDWLKPYIRKAIESWQPAFEAAGFKNAILAKDPPKDDKDWAMEDVRNTVVRWLPSVTENAQGPHVADPRTGEILNGSIRMFHNIMNLQRTWYFTQAAAVDPRARTWPIPDSLMGRLVQYVVAHEIGHTLGLTHNHKASSTYPLDSVRSVSWLKKMGHTPSIMSYSRFNYVAQPEDNIPPELLIPGLGPYDKFAIMWGYAPIPGTNTPQDERQQLNQWARMQDTIPWYRFSRMTETRQYGNPDYADQREAVGNADAIRATELGIRNIKRIAPMMIPTAVKGGEDYSDLREIYGRLVGQWAQELVHVADIVGGAETQFKYGGQAGAVFTPLPRARQREAMRFLNTNAFRTPTYLIDPNVTRLLEPTGSLSRIGNAQARVLSQLLAVERVNRIAEFEATATKGNPPYTVAEFLEDLRQGLWSELSAGSVVIDPYRRNLQRAHVGYIGQVINPPTPTTPQQAMAPRPTGDYVAGIRASLLTLQRQVAAATPRAGNAATRAHLLDVSERIKEILDPK